MNLKYQSRRTIMVYIICSYCERSMAPLENLLSEDK